jgi:hypothetical protein
MAACLKNHQNMLQNAAKNIGKSFDSYAGEGWVPLAKRGAPRVKPYLRGQMNFGDQWQRLFHNPERLFQAKEGVVYFLWNQKAPTFFIAGE